MGAFQQQQETNNMGYGVQPPQYNVKKDRDWFMSNLRFIGTKYNPVMPQFNFQPYEPSRNQIPDRFVNNFYNCLSYIHGKQNNIQYGYFTRDFNNNPLPTRLINDQTAYNVFKHIIGYVQRNIIRNFDQQVFARGLTSELLEDKSARLNLMKMLGDLKFVEYQMGQFEAMGVQIDPTIGFEYNPATEAAKYSEESLQEAVEKIFTGVAKDFLYEIDWVNAFKVVAEYVIIGGLGRFEIIAENGNLNAVFYRPDACIFHTDGDRDNEYGEFARYGGTLDRYTIPAILTRWGDQLSDTEKDELQKMAQAQSPSSQFQGISGFVNYYNGLYGGNNLLWWNMQNNVPIVTCLRGKWIGVEEVNGKYRETVYEGTLIGNKYLVDVGKAKNIIEHSTDKSKVYLPYVDYMPDMLGGFNRSIIARLTDKVDRISGLQAAIDLAINRSNKSGSVVWLSQLPAGFDAQKIMTDLATMGVTFLEGVDTDETGNSRSRLADNVGFEVKADIIAIIQNEIERLKREIREITSMPEAVMGQEATVVSQKALQNQIDQASLGMNSFYEGMSIFFQKVVQRACDIAKLVYTKDEQKRAIKFSPRQAEIIKFTKDMALHDLKIYINRRDAIDEQERIALRDYAFNMTQNPDSGVDMLDVMEIEGMTSRKEIINYLRHKKWIREQQKAAEQQAMMQQEQMLQQQQIDGQLANTQLQQEGNIEKELVKGDIQAAQQMQLPLT